MILFVSDGRLGNQLFQYAFLATIVKPHERICCFKMEQFSESFELENPRFIAVKAGRNAFALFNRIIRPYVLMPLAKLGIVGYIAQEKRGNVSLPSVTNRRGWLPIRFVETNFFQSEKFFLPEKVKIGLNAHAVAEAETVISSLPEGNEKVFIHVRRGDYSAEVFNGERGIDLPKRYFEAAMRRIRAEVENPFFVFLSDDPEYVECCFESVQNKYVSRNGMLTDLALMSLCSYGIASNSSFSWWGAYFMQTKKRVIFPKYWYGWKSKQESHIDIQPSWGEVIDVD